MSSYLLIKRLSVCKMNAMANSYLVNSISMNAVFGFAHNMSRQLNFNLKSVGLVVHDLNLHGVNTPNEKQHLKAVNAFSSIAFDIPKSSEKMLSGSCKPDGSPSAVPRQPVVLMDGTVSIVLEIDEDVPIRKVRTFLSNNRFSGGYFSNKEFNIQFEEDESEISSLIGSGSAVVDANHYVNKKDKLTSMLLLSSLFAIKNNFFMTSIGYSRIMELSNNTVGVRNDLPHAYCESIVGLCEYKNILKDNVFEKHFPMWKYLVKDGNHYLDGNHAVFSNMVELKEKKEKEKT